ncbi:MAG TPA: DUF5804 family protein [Methanoregula sp.]|nr:DUF5804 family protein [Methanoregula sp.]
MNILLVQREGTDLHTTLFSSETSRMALRFYHPKRMPCGVYISVSTLGSALSLVAELRWYLRRYVREALFEVSKGIYCTHILAQDVYYERTAILGTTWQYRKLYGFREGKLISQLVMDPGSVIEDYHQEYAGIDQAIEIWCTEDELGERMEPDEDAGEGVE